MKTGNVIMQLRSLVPDFDSRVSGAAEFLRAVELEATMDMPAGYVIFLGDAAGENDEPAGLHQWVTATIAVVVATDASADRRGQSGQEAALALQDAINSAILNWTPPDLDAPRGFELAGSELLHWDRGRLWHEYRYRITYLVTDSDGWQAPAVDLDEVEIIATKPTVTDWTNKADIMVKDGGSGLTSPAKAPLT